MNKHLLSICKNKKIVAAVLATVMASSYSYNTFAAEPEVDEQGRTVHHIQIIEDENWGAVQNDYWKQTGIRLAKKKPQYTFTTDTLISVDANDKNAYDTCEWSRVVRGIAWAGDKDGKIDMTGHSLDIKAFGPHEYNIFGMQVSSGGLTIDNVKSMDILVKDASNANGLVVVGTANCGAWYNGDGSPRLTINNADGMENAVKIRFENCFGGGYHAIEVDGGSGRADLTVKGLVDAETQGMYNKGLRATDGTLEISHTNIGGGRIVSHDSNSIYSFGGEVNINAQLAEDGSISVPHADNPVVLYGNIRADGARTVDSNITIGMNNSESRLDGTVQVVNQFGHTGNVNLALANGAIWNNEWLDKDDNTKGLWNGSYVKNLQGGSDAGHAGVILQKAEKNLNIDTYSGNTLVIYEHTDNGTKAENYKAGNVVINNAKPESGIVLSTDNTGISLENQTEVNKVLSALSGKIYYMSSDKNANLTGKVQIADGLTSSSQALKLGDISFGSDHKGQYTADGVVVGDYNFTQALTGDVEENSQYEQAGVIFDDGYRYEFREGSTASIDVVDTRAAISLGANTENTVINNKGGKLLLNNKGTMIGGTVSGFARSIRENATINAGDVIIKVDNTDYGRAEGIHADYSKKGERAKTTINANVAANVYGNDYALGIYTSGNAELEVNGNVTMRGEGGKYGVDNFDTGTYEHYSISGIYAGANYSIQMGSKVVVNGDTDLYINGSGVVANGGGSSLELNGNTNIEIAKSLTSRQFAVEAESATADINMNKEKTAAAGNKVTINGNIGSTTGSVHDNEANKHSEINIGLSTRDSVLHGVIVNEFEGNHSEELSGSSSDINLYISNGATWINEAWGKTTSKRSSYVYTGSVASKIVGGVDAEHAGTIVQKDKKDLTIKDYSGHNVVIYEHTGDGKTAENYTGGKTIIESAASGSGIVISTDSHDINLDDYDHIDAVMSNLAGKIVYEAHLSGEANLKGRVQIADGLTSSSKGIEISDITFSDEDGSGVYTPAPDRKPRQKETDFYVPIFGRGMGNGDEKPFEDANVKVGAYEYLFQKDSALHGNKYSGAAIKVLGEQTKIDASNVNLTISGEYGGRFAGIIIGALPEKHLDLTAKNLIINVTSINNVAYGIQSGNHESSIFVGDNTMNVKGNVLIKGVTSKTDAAYGIHDIGSVIKIDGDLVMKSDSNSWGVVGNNDKGVAGIVVGQNKTNWGDFGGNVTVTGNTELVVNGDGIITQNKDASVDLKRGVKIKVAKDEDNEFYAIRATEGTVNITESEGMLTIPGPIPGTGDLIEIYGNVEAIGGTVNLAMKSNLSVFNGVVTGKNFNLELINGANWLNSSYGNASFDFKGSYVNNFKGSKNPLLAGAIVQSDSNDLTINNFSGNTIVMYEHTEDGTLSEHYKGGNTIINNAAEGSGIIVATSNTGINMRDEEVVTKVLNTLAGKLYYMNSAVDTNLSGKVQIADGLTSSSKVLQVGDIKFNEGHQGEYVEGSITPGVAPAHTYTQALTGSSEDDTQYAEAGVISEDELTYDFGEGSEVSITVEDVRAGIVVDKNSEGMQINAANGNITINHTSTKEGSSISGFTATGVDGVAVNTKDLIINVDNKDLGRAEAVHVDKSQRGTLAKTTINSNIKATVKGNDYALGIYSSGNAELEVNGNITMRGEDGSYGVDNFGTGAYDHYSISGIYAGANYTIQTGAKVIVNGNTDLYINGSGVVANGGGSYIELNGDTNIEIAQSKISRQFAVEAESATVNINMDADKHAAAEHKVNIKGNIGTTVGSAHENEANKHSEVNIGLSTKESKLQGVIVNEFEGAEAGEYKGYSSDVNLYISNGATWSNEIWGKTTSSKSDYKFTGSVVNKLVGGIDREHAGIIEQNNSKDLTIKNYSGFSYLVYDHTENGTKAEHYAAGNTIIKNAGAGSGIIVTTDTNGINMDSNAEKNAVLNTLANKLTYEAFAKGEKNLAGKVLIADGLTTSGSYKEVDIQFDEKTGQGGYIPTQTIQKIVGGLSGIAKNEYIDANIQNEDGSYRFTEDTTIESRYSSIFALENLKIDAKGRQLDLKVDAKGQTSENVGTGVAAIVAGYKDGKSLNITADRINISATTGIENNYAAGIYGQGSYEADMDINANVDIKSINAENGSAYGIQNKKANITIGGDLLINGISAKEGFKAVGINAKDGQVLVTGDTSIKNMLGNAVVASGEKAMVGLNRNVAISVADDDVVRYAINAENGATVVVGGAATTFAADADADQNVLIEGNVRAASAADVSMKLTTGVSKFNGVAFAEGGDIDLQMANGATWTNEAFGAVAAGFTGSHVDNFVGGADYKHAAIINQKDSNALTIDNYSGYAVAVYEHEAATPTTIEGGDLVVKAAAAGSGIKLFTDNSGIDMQDKTAVDGVLSALAQKLVYEAAATNAADLKAKVLIADGLTTASKGWEGDVSYDAAGKGQFVVDSSGQVTVDPIVDTNVVDGAYETTIMRGVRNVAMTNMMMWREAAADMGYRAAELREGAEDGIWARTYGGKAKYDANQDKFENSYWGAQVGYDSKASGGWNIGVAFDYNDGDGDYVMSGESENKLYSFGAYATKAASNGAYVDLAAKIGSVNGDYTVYNEIGTTDFSGEYKAMGYSVSAEYGKRFGSEDKGYFEPQVQLTWAHVNSDDYTGYSKKADKSMSINQEAFDSLVGRIGIEAGKETAKGGFYGRLSVAHEFAGDVDASYLADGDTKAKATSFEMDDTWSELTLGGHYQMSANSNFYIDFTKSLSGDYQQDWKVNGGLRFTF